MRNFLVVPATIGIVVATSALGYAQSGTASATHGGITALTCADIANLDAGYQSALIYYAAGFEDGIVGNLQPVANVATSSSASSEDPLRHASASTELGSVTVTGPGLPSSSSAAEPASAASSAMPMTAPTGGQVGGLGLQSDTIVTACKSSPGALLTDVIAQHGGASGAGGAITTTSTSGTAGIGAAPGSPLPPASAAASGTSDSGTGAVSADLNAASQQLNTNLSGTQPGAGSTTNPTGTTPATTNPGTTTPGTTAPGANAATPGAATSP